MRNPVKLLVFGAALLSLGLAAVPALAHHAFSPEFDWTKPVTITGTVVEVEWKAPHALVTVESKEAGTMDRWTVELGSPKVLAKYGWPEQGLKHGDQVTVDGWRAQDGRKMISARFFKLSNGRMLFGASSFFDIPYRASNGQVGMCISDETCVEMSAPISER